MAPLAREALQKEGTLRLKVYGRSMAPWLKSDDEVIVSYRSHGRVSFGDIIAFVAHGDILVHRCIFKLPGILAAKGDYSLFWDGLIKPHSLLGTIIRIQRGTRIINLQRREAKILNYIIGCVSFCVAVSYQSARKLKRFIQRIA